MEHPLRKLSALSGASLYVVHGYEASSYTDAGCSPWSLPGLYSHFGVASPSDIYLFRMRIFILHRHVLEAYNWYFDFPGDHNEKFALNLRRHIELLYAIRSLDYEDSQN